MADSLEDFARRRLEATGANTPSAEAREAERRATVRTNVRRAYGIPLVMGAIFFLGGLVTSSWAVALWLGLVDTDRRALLVLAFTGVSLLPVGLVFLWVSRGFRVPWHLATSGTRARAIVLSVESWGKATQRKYGPIVASTCKVRLAVQVDGGAPYETQAISVDQLHGALVPGQALSIFVDPASPARVLIAEP
jgi:hypothetical protein